MVGGARVGGDVGAGESVVAVIRAVSFHVLLGIVGEGRTCVMFWRWERSEAVMKLLM